MSSGDPKRVLGERTQARHTPGETEGHRKGLDDTHASGNKNERRRQQRQMDKQSPTPEMSGPAASADEELTRLEDDEGPGPAEGRTDNKAGG